MRNCNQPGKHDGCLLLSKSSFMLPCWQFGLRSCFPSGQSLRLTISRHTVSHHSTLYLPSAYFFLSGPALPAVQWEFRTFENSLETANPYKGPPRPELDKAWNKLLDPSAIRLSKEDLNRINRSSVAILDGSGYFGTLGLFTRLLLWCILTRGRCSPSVALSGESEPPKGCRTRLGGILTTNRDGFVRHFIRIITRSSLWRKRIAGSTLVSHIGRRV